MILKVHILLNQWGLTLITPVSMIIRMQLRRDAKQAFFLLKQEKSMNSKQAEKGLRGLEI